MLRDLSPDPQTGTVRKARALRRGMSLPERLIWRELRQRPFGLKFRRQHPSGPFVLDFYCGDARLGIEIDGIAHAMGERAKRDSERDAYFAKAGIEILRVAARDVLADPSGSVEAIVSAARDRLPPHHPAAPGGPPPRDELGED